MINIFNHCMDSSFYSFWTTLSLVACGTNVSRFLSAPCMVVDRSTFSRTTYIVIFQQSLYLCKKSIAYHTALFATLYLSSKTARQYHMSCTGLGAYELCPTCYVGTAHYARCYQFKTTPRHQVLVLVLVEQHACSDYSSPMHLQPTTSIVYILVYRICMGWLHVFGVDVNSQGPGVCVSQIPLLYSVYIQKQQWLSTCMKVEYTYTIHTIHTVHVH